MRWGISVCFQRGQLGGQEEERSDGSSDCCNVALLHVLTRLTLEWLR